MASSTCRTLWSEIQSKRRNKDTDRPEKETQKEPGPHSILPVGKCRRYASENSTPATIHTTITATAVHRLTPKTQNWQLCSFETSTRRHYSKL